MNVERRRAKKQNKKRASITANSSHAFIRKWVRKRIEHFRAFIDRLLFAPSVVHISYASHYGTGGGLDLLKGKSRRPQIGRNNTHCCTLRLRQMAIKSGRRSHHWVVWQFALHVQLIMMHLRRAAAIRPFRVHFMHVSYAFHWWFGDFFCVWKRLHRCFLCLCITISYENIHKRRSRENGRTIAENTKQCWKWNIEQKLGY